MPTQIWRCPECETINKEAVCTVCGTEKPIQPNPTQDKEPPPHVNAEEIEAPNYGPNNKRVKAVNSTFNGLIILIWVLIAIIIAMAIVIYMLVSDKDDSEKRIANANAQLIYSNALNYCVQCRANGVTVADGGYDGNLSTASGNYSYSGTSDDLDEYLSYMVGGSENAGVYYIDINNGVPYVSVWNISEERLWSNLEKEGVYPPNISGIPIYEEYKELFIQYNK